LEAISEVRGVIVAVDHVVIMIIESIVKNCELIQKRELDSLCMSEEVDDGSKRMLEVERDEVGLNAKIVLMEPGVHKVELVATEVVVIDVST
jgi:hypothetical protein